MGRTKSRYKMMTPYANKVSILDNEGEPIVQIIKVAHCAASMDIWNPLGTPCAPQKETEEGRVFL